jgi:hypothetical protein
VTQQFNTTTSMGRLTLNVLLSFAQFEREVIGERIRDKIAASKKKGMWMGGVPPLGYRVQDRKLVIVDSEAEIVRSIFCRYTELGSVRLLKAELEAEGIKSKSRTSVAGRLIGGKPFSRGALYLMLRNRSYRGEIVHKGQSHSGEHPPIIDPPLWDAVQMRLAGNTAERISGTRTHQPSLLAGMLFDAEGNRMTPSYAIKKDTRYRYYVSRPLITQDQRERSTALRIPAGEIEQLVTSRVRQWLLDPGGIYQATRLPDPSAQHRLIARAGEIGNSWTELPATTTACLPDHPDRPHRCRGSSDRYPFAPDPARRTPRYRSDTPAERQRRNPDAVRADTPAARRAGDQDVDRGDQPVCHSKT